MKTFARGAIVACLLAGSALAADLEFPSDVRWATYHPMAAQQARAIGDALHAASGATLHVQPGGSDLANAGLLRDGTVDFAATAVAGSIAAQEGVFDFAAADWGPQKVRLVLANTDEPINFGIAVAGDAGVETYADLKGKRVAWYTDLPVVNVNTEAHLAYGGLSWDDVTRVEVAGSFEPALNALRDGQLDAAFAGANERSRKAAEGPRGLVWPPVDPADTAGLKRLEAVAPYFVPHTASQGPAAAGAAEQHPGVHYPYPILVAREDTDAGLVEAMTTALIELYPRYEGKAFGIDGWAVDPQQLLWFVPYHDGAVAALTEAGVWTDAAQAHNDRLVARQEALAAAWAALKAEAPDDWQAAWEARRHEALADGGFRPVF